MAIARDFVHHNYQNAADRQLIGRIAFFAGLGLTIIGGGIEEPLAAMVAVLSLGLGLAFWGIKRAGLD